MISGGFEKSMFTTINNFIDIKNVNNDIQEKENYYCYVGRLSTEKGIETLLKASMELPEYRLKVIGTGPLYDYLIKQYSYAHI